MGWADPGLHYRKIRDRIHHAIADAYTRVPNDIAEEYTTYVLAAGFQRKTRFPKGLNLKWTWQRMPVMFWVGVNRYGTTASELMARPVKDAREIGQQMEFFVSSVGTYEPSLRAQTEQRVKSYSCLPTATANGVMEILLDEIQDTALAHPETVGMDARALSSTDPPTPSRPIFASQRKQSMRSCVSVRLRQWVQASPAYRLMSTVYRLQSLSLPLTQSICLRLQLQKSGQRCQVVSNSELRGGPAVSCSRASSLHRSLRANRASVRTVSGRHECHHHLHPDSSVTAVRRQSANL